MASGRRPTADGSQPVSAALVALVIILFALGSWLSLTSLAAPVNITVPFSPVPVAPADFDGDPSTGDWSDALTVDVPLENGEAGVYGVAKMFAKHDGINVYFRLDGSIDVPWISAAGDHFWVGIQISKTGTEHHAGGSWDGLFFGLWDGTHYTPAQTAPVAVDTNGFDKPPAMDSSQDVVGTLTHSGTIAPFTYTVEWYRPLDTGDSGDIAFVADGVATYNFFISTDSDGDGSQGGLITHNQVTNRNTMTFASATANLPPTVSVTNPSGNAVWTGGEFHEIQWAMNDDTTPSSALVVWLNYTGDAGEGVIAGPFVGETSYVWVVPAINGADVRINVTVRDSQGAATFMEAPVPIVDAVPVDREAPSHPEAILLESHAPGCVEVIWTPAQAEDLGGYRVYRLDPDTATMTLWRNVSKDAHSAEDCEGNADHARTYWVTAVDESGNESPPSSIVTGFPATEPVASPEPNTGLNLALIGLGVLTMGSVVYMAGSKNPLLLRDPSHPRKKK
jgi:hypothetical protein